MPVQRSRYPSQTSLGFGSNSSLMEVSGVSRRDYVQMLMRMSAEHIKLLANQQCDWSIASRVFKYAEEDDREWLAIVTALTSLPSGPFSHVFINCFIQYWLPVPPVSENLIQCLVSHINERMEAVECDHGPMNACILLHALAYKYSGVVSEGLLSPEILGGLLRILRDPTNRLLQMLALQALEAFAKCNVNKVKILDAGVRQVLKGVLISLDARHCSDGPVVPPPHSMSSSADVLTPTYTGANGSEFPGHGAGVEASVRNCDTTASRGSELVAVKELAAHDLENEAPGPENGARTGANVNTNTRRYSSARTPSSTSRTIFIHPTMRSTSLQATGSRSLSNMSSPSSDQHMDAIHPRARAASFSQSGTDTPSHRAPLHCTTEVEKMERNIRTRRYSLRSLLSKISRTGMRYDIAKKCSSCGDDRDEPSAHHVAQQLAFCATWALDNSFFALDDLLLSRPLLLGKPYMLDHSECGRHVKISADGLEVRNDTHEFESIRGGMGVSQGCYYYETQVLGPFCFQIGWTTGSVTYYQGGDGVGDDVGSVGYDPVRQLLWSNRGTDDKTVPAQASRPMQSGDVLGFYIELFERAKYGRYTFALNGEVVVSLHSRFPVSPETRYYPAASFNYQHLRFNFGQRPFKFEPPPHYEPLDACVHQGDYNFGLARIPSAYTRHHEHIEILKGRASGRTPTPLEGINECQICFEKEADVTIMPCTHDSMCMSCLLRCTHCPMCRVPIEDRLTSERLHKYQEAA